MPYQITSLEMKALQNRSKVDAIRNKNPKTLKGMDLQEEEQYQGFRPKKRKKPKPKAVQGML